MKRTATWMIVLLAVAIALGALAAQLFPRPVVPGPAWKSEQRSPRPELPVTHGQPVTEYPVATPVVWEYVDTGVLVAALAAAAWLALKKRSRRGIFLLMIFSLAYFGFYRRGCVCPIGAIQHVAAAIFQSGYAVPVAVLLFFGLPLLFALFFGRVFCSSVCPLGAAQDIVLLRPMKVPRWLEQGLGLFAYVYLGLAVLFAATGAGYVICRYDPFVSFFRLSGGANMFVLGLCFLVISMFVGRPYCRYLCPYGALLRLLSKVTQWHVTITPDECIKCRLCEEACPFGAIRKPTTEADNARTEGKVRLGLLILALPVIVAAGAWLGHQSSPVLAGAHPTVIRAKEVRHDQAGPVATQSDRTTAFLKTGKTLDELYAQEADVLRRFKAGGAIFGAWVGLIVAARLIALSVRRKRTDYEAEHGPCLACGRCFAYCPREHLRLKELRGEPGGGSSEQQAGTT